MRKPGNGVPRFSFFRSNINNKLMGFVFDNDTVLHYKWYRGKAIYIFKWISIYCYDICGIAFFKTSDRITETTYFCSIGGNTFKCCYNI